MIFEIVVADLFGFLFAALNARVAWHSVKTGQVAIEGQSLVRPIILASRKATPVRYWAWVVLFAAIAAFLLAVAVVLLVRIVLYHPAAAMHL